MTQFSTLTAYLRARFGNTERGASLVEIAVLVLVCLFLFIVALWATARGANDGTNTYTPVHP